MSLLGINKNLSLRLAKFAKDVSLESAVSVFSFLTTKSRSESGQWHGTLLKHRQSGHLHKKQSGGETRIFHHEFDATTTLHI
jgi:hypothetical protein